MRQELLSRLRQITPEERELLEGRGDIQRELYTSRREFVVDSRKLLEKGRLIEIRPHTRFAHFPCHRHNYVELVYMCSGSTTHIVNQTEKLVLEEGDLLFLNQNACHEILPAGEGDVAVNFIILPEFFHRPVSMIERENLLRDLLASARLDRPAYQISRLLKKHTGCHFKELLGRRKLQQAVWLLSNTTLPIDAVIASIGYDNSSYFSRRFRERYGCSPGEFRGAQSSPRAARAFSSRSSTAPRDSLTSPSFWK